MIPPDHPRYRSLITRELLAESVKKGIVSPEGLPARLGLGFSSKEIQDLTDNKLPDPIAEAFKFLGKQIETLEKRMAEMEQEQGIRVELDQYVEQKKQEIMGMFTSAEDFSVGAGI